MNEKKFNPLNYPVCLDSPIWFDKTAWAEHIPFAMYVVAAARPKTFVELGTYYGVSYFAFCQAVKALNLDTNCYAVDTWQGDEHAGEIEQSILSKIEIHNSSHYADFSRLVQSTFDEAKDHFPDGSIDLLHIDGFHTFDAVSHDFETWFPKMSARGVVIFHDINVRERGFGVWKFWDEISRKHPGFAFLHGHGLGVLSVGEHIPENLQNLFSADEKETVSIRKFFHQYGASIEATQNFNAQREMITHLQTHEALVKKSLVMRAYRVLRYEGIGGFLRKAGK